MVFNSYIFTLGFLPLLVIIYYSLNYLKLYSLSKIMLIGASLLFIGYEDKYSLCFFLLSALLSWILGTILFKQVQYNAAGAVAKFILGIAVFIQVAMMLYHKYTYFILQNINGYMHTSFSVGKILIPAGISFITFQQISFLTDIYRGKIKEIKLGDYFFYISYFPKFLQGPITKYNDLVPQINDMENKRINMENLSYGLWLFATGLARKVFLADTLSKAVSWGYGSAIADITAMDALLVSFCFTFQIYFDFSGYSHMALGISKLLNLRLPDNFDSPYISVSIIDFWKRWHISLTSFLREYLYFPLGGSKKGKARTYLNTMIVFLVSGLWHGAAWNFVAWGGLHGAAQCLNKAFEKQWEKLHVIFRWVVTFLFVDVMWIFFRADSVSQAESFIQKIFRMENRTVSAGLMDCFQLSEIEFLTGRIPVFGDFINQHPAFVMSVFLLLAFVLCLNIKDRVTEFKPTITKCIITILLFGWSVVSFSTVVKFIYENF